MTRRWAVGAVAVLVISLTACGSVTSSSPTTTTPVVTTTTLSPVASAYVADVDPVNVAWHNFLLQVSAWNSRTTAAQAETVAAPLITSLQSLNAKLITVQVYDQWGIDGRHVNALMSAIAYFEGDLSGLALSSPSSIPTASLQMLHRDYASLSSAIDRVRADVGLPPLPGSDAVS
jgi:hypothetical protein